MSLRTIFFPSTFALTLICLCSCCNEEWPKHLDFSKIPEDCVPKSCSDLETDQAKSDYPCDCDETCSRYATCCIDSPYAALTPTRSFGKRMQCSPVQGSSFAAFMVSTCNPRWRGSQVIRTLCERIGPNHSDPLAKIPVTNSFSKITYRNYFCSLCNFDHSEGVLWNVLLTVSPANPSNISRSSRESILQRLEYDASRNTWGIWDTGYGGVSDFIPVAVSADIPRDVSSVVKKCDTNARESRCATTWNDATVKMMCQSYLSPITLPVGEGSSKRFVEFRNPHCAVCNYVSNFEYGSCAKYKISFSPNLSFTLLLDVNPSDGDEVGETSSCSKNEVYDPFFKKCRALVCALPGYVVKNGRCVNA